MTVLLCQCPKCDYMQLKEYRRPIRDIVFVCGRCKHKKKVYNLRKRQVQVLHRNLGDIPLREAQKLLAAYNAETNTIK